jgi:hypothetical protein
MQAYLRARPLWLLLSALLAGTLLLAACGDAAPAAEEDEPTTDSEVASSGAVSSNAPDEQPEAAPADQADAPDAAGDTLLPEEPPPAGAESEFDTDFSRHTVPYNEILSGGPPKDGIPSIDDPEFVSTEEADEWLEPLEPVLRVEVGEVAKAYPIQILMWHEIVNDTVNGKPLAVTFCPLCNTGIVLERTIDGEAVELGTTGRLRFSNLIMYDRKTETWWQQGTGEAIAGDLAGEQLAFYPADMIAWEDFKQAHPDGQVLSRDTGFSRSYGENPYAGYDNINSTPFLFEGPATPDELPAMARVLTVDLGGEAVAYPYEALQEEQVINDTVGDTPIVVLWSAGTASALDAHSVAGGRDVGAANAYSREVDGRVLTFALEDGQMVDQETGSVWDEQGHAISGELEGSELEPVVAINHFWFSWAAFKPETRIYAS